MVDDPTVEKPIVVASQQGTIDGLQAAIRYLIVLFGFFSGLASIIGKGDALAAATFVQDNLGPVVGAVFGLISLATMLYGIYKTFRRGAELSTAASSPRVSDTVLTLKRPVRR